MIQIAMEEADQGQPAIHLDRVSKSFTLDDGFVLSAIEDVDLKVSHGEFIALLGPSGCGKSTILRLIAALDQATNGTVNAYGRSPHELSKTHMLGAAFQDHALLPWLSVEKNIALPYRITGRPIEKGRVQQLIDLVGLSGFEKTRPTHLSGGMRQRVSIARALVLRPKILLLDEPFGALDSVTRRHMNIELQRIWSEECTTTVLVTHAVEEALFLADRVVIMGGHPGRVTRTQKVPFIRPRSPSVQQLSEFHRLADELTAALERGAH